ncbi:MAG: hypothetical protein AAGA72_17105 [Pseudomonadota bacterium]
MLKFIVLLLSAFLLTELHADAETCEGVEFSREVADEFDRIQSSIAMETESDADIVLKTMDQLTQWDLNCVERGQVLRLTAYAYAKKGNYSKASIYFEMAVESGAFPEGGSNVLRQLAFQYYFAAEEYDNAISMFTRWNDFGGQPAWEDYKFLIWSYWKAGYPYTALDLVHIHREADAYYQNYDLNNLELSILIELELDQRLNEVLELIVQNNPSHEEYKELLQEARASHGAVAEKTCRGTVAEGIPSNNLGDWIVFAPEAGVFTSQFKTIPQWEYVSSLKDLCKSEGGKNCYNIGGCTQASGYTGIAVPEDNSWVYYACSPNLDAVGRLAIQKCENATGCSCWDWGNGNRYNSEFRRGRSK